MWRRRSAAVQRGKEDGTVREMAGAVQRSSARCCSKMEERGVGVRCRSAHVEEGGNRGGPGMGGTQSDGRYGQPDSGGCGRLLATWNRGREGEGGGWHVGRLWGGA
jgi:hypothetical protein